MTKQSPLRMFLVLGCILSLLQCEAPAQPASDAPFLGAVTQPTERGAEITSIVPNSPAAKAGLAVGDAVRSVDGFLVGRKGPVVFSLPSEIRRSGGDVRLTVMQKSSNRMVDKIAHVGGPAQPVPPPPVQRRGRLGIRTVHSTAGETIAEVTPNTPAAAAGLRLNDVITAVDNFKVGLLNGNVYSLPSEIRRSQGTIQLAIRRGSQELQVPVDLGQPPKGLATRVHVLLIGLTDDKAIGQGCASNLEFMLNRVKEAFKGSPNIVKVQTLYGRNVTADNILKLVDNTTVGPTETLFCYYAGHGAYDPRFAADDPSFGHHFQITGQDLLRRSLRDHLIERAARLTVLVTDTCNVKSNTRPDLQPRGLPPSDEEMPLYSLLMRHSGVVDISGTARDQYGWYHPSGGIFTMALYDCLESRELNTWDKLAEATTFQTDSLFQMLRNKILANPSQVDPDVLTSMREQQHQSPESFIVSVQPIPDAAPPNMNFNIDPPVANPPPTTPPNSRPPGRPPAQPPRQRQ